MARSALIDAPANRFQHAFGESNANAIAILGGTGDQGLGLAFRFAKAGRPVVIGSRKLERAREAVAEQALRLFP